MPKSDPRFLWQTGRRNQGVILALVALALVVSIAAASSDRSPTPLDEDGAALVDFAPTNEELLAMPPSIERYTAAHTLPMSTLTEAGIARADQQRFSYVPLATFGIAPQPRQVVLTAGLPNGFNAWTVSWTTDPLATGYELQEAQSPNFAGATTTTYGAQAAVYIQKAPTPSNVYYYRVRSVVGGLAGPWSNVGMVVGGYRDEFSDPNSGWALRRTTYIEEVHAYYDEGEYVLDVNDRWDWGISSPGVPAPRVPYVVDFYATIVGGANLWSFGGVVGGDWPSLSGCPSVPDGDGWYKHQDCFNQFYNTNAIFYGPIKLQWERIDQLEWCLNCGGSPMKRLGDVNPGSVKTLKLVDPTGWNHYRIEVREDVIRFYAAKLGFEPELQYLYFDTRYVDQPYFGLFASTDEYTNALWRFDNFQVMPID